jgi:hypothetical protein
LFRNSALRQLCLSAIRNSVYDERTQIVHSIESSSNLDEWADEGSQLQVAEKSRNLEGKSRLSKMQHKLSLIQ